jgi:arginyl-tRNA--protein-N-Asp/Glu arginylyltransferase
MNLNKICPDCETEYLPHIEKCADCGTVLLLHEEYSRVREEKKQLAEKAVRNAVMLREGDLKWLDELCNVLIDAGIPCSVISDEGCNKGRCGDNWQLIASKEDVERAEERIEEYFMEMHPEIRASNELVSQGKCPACGSPVRAGANECLDCGLTLVIIEEEDEE